MSPCRWIALYTMVPLGGCAPAEDPLGFGDTGKPSSGPHVVLPLENHPAAHAGDTATSLADLGGPALDAQIQALPADGPVPLTVTFDAKASTGAYSGVEWRFGDGERAQGERARHTYLTAGTYTAGAILRDRFGQHSVATLTVEVTPGACPTAGDHEVLGSVEHAGIDEASGLVDSRKNPGVLWVHNDSGDGPQLYALTHTGEHLGVWELEGGSARDWEDLAVGMDPDTGEQMLYIGDVGDNSGTRDTIVVYRVPEPDVDADGGEQGGAVKGATLELDYPEDEAHNSETLMVDPVTDTIYVVTKSYDGATGVFRKPPPHVDGERSELEEVVWLDFSQDPLSGSATTGGEFSPLGDRFVIRTYWTTAYMWLRDGTDSLEDVLTQEPCALQLPSERQSETIAFSATEDALFSISEGDFQPVNWIPLER